MRLIDADELINDIDYSADLGGALGKVVEVVKLYAKFMAQATPTIETQKWIPCSERLPEPNEFVLVQNQNLQCFVFCMREEEVWYDYDFVYQNEGIIAWMPLPEPYKEGEE